MKNTTPPKRQNHIVGSSEMVSTEFLLYESEDGQPEVLPNARRAHAAVAAAEVSARRSGREFARFLNESDGSNAPCAAALR